ncbi:MAG: ABC transporter ATP-binding protein [Proteobacteria bacterium]|nr:ABC transporter ATP-binding protein [Pseudomonadota bacterium]
MNTEPGLGLITDAITEPTAGTDAAIVADGVTVRHGDVTVLNDVRFALPRGAVLGVVGRNGAGKTTLLRALLGLVPTVAGEARLYGCDSRALDDRVRARLGYVAQSPEFYGWLRVRELLALFGQSYPAWTEERMRELAARFDLAVDLRVRHLSPGERQRLAIVLAMQHRPDLLIFDEPVASLDPLGRRDFLRLLFERDEEGPEPLTAIISSHLLDDLERVATHLLFLHQGRVQLFGERDGLAEHLHEVVTAAPLPTRDGVLRSRRQGDGAWRSLIDDRRLALATLPAGATCRPLGLLELFVALNG